MVVGFDAAIQKVHRFDMDFFIDRFHALRGQRPGVLDDLAAFAISGAVQDSARTVFLFELGILGVVVGFWFFFGVQVVEIAKELVKACSVGRCLSWSPK